MLKRYFTLILIMLTLAATFSSCKKQEEYGEIEDVEIIAGEPAEESTPAFSKASNPFSDYKYKEVEFDCAKMHFEIPSSWNEQVMNNSCIKYTTPADDPHFPGCNFYVKCVYDFSTAEDQLDPFASYANEYGTVMSPYITGLPFLVEGKDAWIRTYSISDESYTPSFCADESEAIIKVTKDLTLTNKKTGDAVAFEDFNFVAAYLRWEGFPVMFCATVPTEATDDAKWLLEYILSGVTKAQHKITQTKGFDYRKIRFTAPSEFAASGESGHIFMTEAKDIKSCAGMSIGVFGLEDAPEMVTEDVFTENYANNIASLLLDPSCASSFAVGASMSETESSLADEKRTFYGKVNILPKEEDYSLAKTMYGPGSVWSLDAYIVERNGQNLVVATMYPPHETEISERVMKMVMQSLSVEK